MNQSPSSALPDIVARRLMQEQELQIVIVNELMRRKLLERSSTDSHKFVLDRQHIASSKLSDFSSVENPNSVFTGIIGKGVGHPVDSEHGAVRADANRNLTLSSVKNSVVNGVQGNKSKLSAQDKQRRERLQEMLLAENGISSPSISCDKKTISPRNKKTISPRKERENHNTMMAPRRHVLKLNLGALITSSAAQLCSPSSHRGSFSERHSRNSSRYEIAFTSARCANVEQPSSTLNQKPSILQSNSSELGTSAGEIAETSFLRNSTTLGNILQPQSVKSSLGNYVTDAACSKRDSHRSKAVPPEIARISGSSAAPGFLRKVHSLRSMLAHPVSCHLPTTPEHPQTHSFSHTQSKDYHLESTWEVQDWGVLIAKYDSNILKSTVKMSND
jgi:hypothetical protein